MRTDDLRFGKRDMSHDGIERRKLHINAISAHEWFLTLIGKFAERHAVQRCAQNREYLQARGLSQFNAIAGPALISCATRIRMASVETIKGTTASKVAAAAAQRMTSAIMRRVNRGQRINHPISEVS